MIIGLPKEIKNNESRVALTPAGVFELTNNGHQVIIQTGAGISSGYEDLEYKGVGGIILGSMNEVYDRAEMIVKVKEPIEAEYDLIKEDQIVFTYFHFASSEKLTRAMIDSGAICIAYETVQTDDGKLPLLTPMSEVAGRMAIQQGAKYLERPVKGKGVLLGGVPGVPPGRVLVLGAGVVGVQAAKMAAGLGAMVTIMDINMDRAALCQ
jgi:alanine dehydrogenase